MKGGWFVAGTDTGIGKTCVAEALLRALARRGWRAVGMKPVATGCALRSGRLCSEDADRIAAASSVAADYADINPYAFAPPIAPHAAAARSGIEMRLHVVQEHFVRLAAQADWVVVEGAGGWLVPFDRRRTLSDVAQMLGLPVVLVVGIRLGCINHALLTERAIRADGMRLAGWVANRVDGTFEAADETVAALDDRLDAPRLAQVPYRVAAWDAYGDAVLRALVGECA